MNGKANQGPVFDINVWCNRSLKTKLHPMIVRQYTHLKVVRKAKNTSGEFLCVKCVLFRNYWKHANLSCLLFFFEINFLPNKTRLKLTLTRQFRPSWATDFFRVTSSSASDFRFCGRQVTSEEGHKHDLKVGPLITGQC